MKQEEQKEGVGLIINTFVLFTGSFMFKELRIS